MFVTLKHQHNLTITGPITLPMCPFLILCVPQKETFVLIFGVLASQPDPFLHPLCFLGCVGAKSEVLVLFTLYLKMDICPHSFEPCFLVVTVKS